MVTPNLTVMQAALIEGTNYDDFVVWHAMVVQTHGQTWASGVAYDCYQIAGMLADREQWLRLFKRYGADAPMEVLNALRMVHHRDKWKRGIK